MKRNDPDLPRVLSSAEARRLGLDRAAVRHAVDAHGWQRLARGIVLTRPGTPTRDDWALVGLELGGPHAALSGWDAARIRGLGARTAPSQDVLVLDRRGGRRRVGQVVIRSTNRRYTATTLPAEHPTLPFVPVVHPARAITDTALWHHSLEPVRAMVTSSIQRGVCSAEDLVAEFRDGPQQGSRWLRMALDDVLAGAKSIAEAEAVALLTRARVPAFEANVAFVDRAGTLVVEVDLLWRSLRMIVEIDSREFHFSEADWKRTLRRHTFLTRRGFAVEHHPPSDVRAGQAAWAAGLADGLRARARELGVPYWPGRGPLPVPDGGHPPIVLADVTRPAAY